MSHALSQPLSNSTLDQSKAPDVLCFVELQMSQQCQQLAARCNLMGSSLAGSAHGASAYVASVFRSVQSSPPPPPSSPQKSVRRQLEFSTPPADRRIPRSSEDEGEIHVSPSHAQKVARDGPAEGATLTWLLVAQLSLPFAGSLHHFFVTGDVVANPRFTCDRDDSCVELAKPTSRYPYGETPDADANVEQGLPWPARSVKVRLHQLAAWLRVLVQEPHKVAAIRNHLVALPPGELFSDS